MSIELTRLDVIRIMTILMTLGRRLQIFRRAKNNLKPALRYSDGRGTEVEANVNLASARLSVLSLLSFVTVNFAHNGTNICARCAIEKRQSRCNSSERWKNISISEMHGFPNFLQSDARDADNFERLSLQRIGSAELSASNGSVRKGVNSARRSAERDAARAAVAKKKLSSDATCCPLGFTWREVIISIGIDHRYCDHVAVSRRDVYPRPAIENRLLGTPDISAETPITIPAIMSGLSQRGNLIIAAADRWSFRWRLRRSAARFKRTEDSKRIRTG